jgi:FMN-dependent NADH-azoreductase
MSKVLVLNRSALGSTSISQQLVQYTLARLRARDPGLEVVTRDLGANPIPHLNTDSATALRGDSQEPHLKTLLSFMGIKDVTFIRAEKLAFGSEARQQALDGARTQLGRLFTESQYMRAA